MGEPETETWRGPTQYRFGGAARWFYGTGTLVWAAGAVAWFTVWREDAASGWLVAICGLNSVFFAVSLLPIGTAVKADRRGLRVFNPQNPSLRRVRWDQIIHFEPRVAWSPYRKDLLVAVKRNGGRVFVGLPVGHEGLASWWARYGGQVQLDQR